MVTDFEFGINLNSDRPLDIDFVRATLQNVETLLRAIEREVSGGQSKVRWEWGEDARLSFVAHVNGVDEATLARVVSIARDGFSRAVRATDSDLPVEWPAEFTAQARESASRILRGLDQLESLTVESTGSEPLEIRRVRLEQVVTGRAVRRVSSSVEGILEMVAHRSGTVRAGLREVGTNHYVRVSFDAVRWIDELRDRALWDKRVTVYGLVSYGEEGEPRSITDIENVLTRESGISLLDFEGLAPELTQGLTAEDHLEKLRGEG